MATAFIESEPTPATQFAADALKNKLSALVLCLLCFALFFFRLDDRDLSSSHEARAGQDAQSMLNSGEWELPRLFDGQVEMQKPPLYYWLVALLGILNGGQVDAWCVRLPSALSAFACVLLLMAWGVRRGRPLAGLLSAIILATSLHFTSLARIGRIDMPLTLTVCLTLVGFWEGIYLRQRHGGRADWPWFLLGYLAIATGVMLKGPIAVALPCIVGAAWWALRRFDSASGVRSPESGVEELASGKSAKVRFRYRIGLHWGLPLVLALTLPWFLWANYRTDGEFFRVFFWLHNIDRGFGTEDHLRAYPWWYYGPQLLLDVMPWSLLLPAAAWSAWRRRDLEGRFGAVWLLAIAVLLSCMRFKRSDYLLPAIPGAAWMLGCFLERWYLAVLSRRFVIGFVAVVAVTAGLWTGYAGLIIPQVEATRTHRRFAAEVRRHTSDPVLFFWAEAHLIAFEVGPPLMTSVAWADLDSLADKPQSSYVVMPLECLDMWPKYLKRGTLEPVIRSTDLGAPPDEWPLWLQQAHRLGLDTRERSYVLVRTHCLPETGGPSYISR
jgi:4-amino-4-deoxy-L-arabinose transferase-like glycosyltransferase